VRPCVLTVSFSPPQLSDLPLFMSIPLVFMPRSPLFVTTHLCLSPPGLVRHHPALFVTTQPHSSPPGLTRHHPASLVTTHPCSSPPGLVCHHPPRSFVRSRAPGGGGGGGDVASTRRWVVMLVLRPVRGSIGGGSGVRAGLCSYSSALCMLLCICIKYIISKIMI
jgi:hypothetical protein